jgi:hypothetical protein
MNTPQSRGHSRRLDLQGSGCLPVPKEASGMIYPVCGFRADLVIAVQPDDRRCECTFLRMLLGGPVVEVQE